MSTESRLSWRSPVVRSEQRFQFRKVSDRSKCCRSYPGSEDQRRLGVNWRPDRRWVSKGRPWQWSTSLKCAHGPFSNFSHGSHVCSTSTLFLSPVSVNFDLSLATVGRNEALCVGFGILKNRRFLRGKTNPKSTRADLGQSLSGDGSDARSLSRSE